MNKILLTAFLFWAASSNASFSETSRRYLSPKDMFTVMVQKFPVLNDPTKTGKFDSTCWVIGANNGNVTGLVNPAFGSPASPQPGAGFVRWWGSCAERIINLQFQALTLHGREEKLWQKYWDATLLKSIRDPNKADSPFHKVDLLKWTALTQRMRDAQVRFLIEEFIGPNAVIADLGYSKGSDELAEILKSTLGTTPGFTIAEANQRLILALILRDEFVSY